MMSLLNDNVSVRVSSVLNRDSKQYGKKMMFDGNDDTCWNSDQGDSQWIKFAFNTVCEAQQDLKLVVQFQGGFSCKECVISALDKDSTAVAEAHCYPEDVNSLQKFILNFFPTASDGVSKKSVEMSAMLITFKNMTDFFGRVTIYYLDVLLCESDAG